MRRVIRQDVAALARSLFLFPAFYKEPVKTFFQVFALRLKQNRL